MIVDYQKPVGTRWVGLGNEAIPESKALQFLRDEKCGAISVFAGTTRKWTNGQQTTSLWYEAYEPMALSEMQKLVDLAEGRWTLHRVVVLHRLGTVPLEQVSVWIGVSTAHRADAFNACRWLIDHLKTEVPIWKKDMSLDTRDSTWLDR